MKKLSRYLPSLIVSLLLVFFIILTAAASVFCINISAGRLSQIASNNGSADIVYSQLEKYWQERYSSTRVPAEVYTDALTKEFLAQHIGLEIRNGFAELRNIDRETNDYQNAELDKSISDFYKKYAEENNFKDDEALEKAITEAQKSARTVIQNNCDVFKFRTMSQHKILSKAAKVFNYRFFMIAAAAAGVLVLMMILLLIDHKEKSAVLYWCGCSALIAGILGTLPCLYLLLTNYFNGFSIKQPQVFKAYTVTMTTFTEAFMSVCIATGAAGIALLIVYAVVTSKDKSVAPTKLEK